MSVTVYAPEGTVGAEPATLAPPRTGLSGLRLGVLDNGKPNAGLLLTHAAGQVAERTGAQLTVVTDKGPGANAATPCTEEVLARLTEQADVVLTGSAD